MSTFIIFALFGAAQIFLTEQLIYAFNKRDAKKILVFLASKFLAYGIVIGILIINFVWQLSLALCGFAVGAPIAAIGIFVYKTIYKR